MVHKVEQVSLSAAMRDENGYALPCYTVWGFVLAFCYFAVFTLHIHQFQRGLKGQLNSSLYRRKQVQAILISSAHDNSFIHFVIHNTRSRKSVMFNSLELGYIINFSLYIYTHRTHDVALRDPLL